MVRCLLGFLVITMVLTSCVPNRNYVLMQKNDVKKKHVPIDSTVRRYDLEIQDMRIVQSDVLLIRFQSLTSEEFDFLSRTSGTNMTGNPQSAVLFGELVSPEGDVNYPVVGKVHVAGLTVFEAQQKLQSLAAQFLESPKVLVRIANFRVTVLGEVKREGEVTLSNNRVSILEVLGVAGGLGDLADRSKVKLIRQQGEKVSVQYLNLLDENLINSPYYFVRQNDIIVVPPLKQRPFRTYFGPNLALLLSTVSVVLLTFNLLNK